MILIVIILMLYAQIFPLYITKAVSVFLSNNIKSSPLNIHSRLYLFGGGIFPWLYKLFTKSLLSSLESFSLIILV